MLFPSIKASRSIFTFLLFLHLIGVGIYCVFSFYNLQLAHETQAQAKEAFKVFGTRGIYLYLVFWTSLFLWTLYTRESSALLKKCAWGGLILLCSGFIGIFFHTNQKHYPIVFFSEEKLSVSSVAEATTLQGVIKFKAFPDSFLTFLQRAEKGSIKLLIKPYIWSSPIQIQIGENVLQVNSENKFLLSPEDIQHFMSHKTLTVSPLFQSPTSKKGLTLNMIIRDTQWFLQPERKLQCRNDMLIYQGKPHRLPKDGAFMIAFYFESNDGKPIIFFY